MANINQIITLGIGTPSDIKHLTLFGLNTTIAGTKALTLPERRIAITLPNRRIALTLPKR